MDRRRRKLLAASVGVAAVSYVVGVACDDSSTSGNLPAPTQREADGDTSDAATGDASDASTD